MRPDALMFRLARPGLLLFPLAMAGCAANPPSRDPVSAVTSRMPPPAHRASDLIGDSAADLTVLFGPPSLRHQDGPAEVWLYAAHGCRLDVVLYRPAADRGGERVSLAEVRSAHPSDAPPSDEGACLQTLAASTRD